MRVLDLGCGEGNPPIRANLSPNDKVIGVDINEQSLAIARQRFPTRTFIRSRGERLPFPDNHFDRVVSGIALPYMNIARTLAEVHRVLVIQGSVFFSLHPLRFTLGELKQAFPNPVPTLYRCWVLANGAVFHVTGLNWKESFQTERAMRIALKRSDFCSIVFNRTGGRLIVEAIKAVTGHTDSKV